MDTKTVVDSIHLVVLVAIFFYIGYIRYRERNLKFDYLVDINGAKLDVRNIQQLGQIYEDKGVWYIKYWTGPDHQNNMWKLTFKSEVEAEAKRNEIISKWRHFS